MSIDVDAGGQEETLEKYKTDEGMAIRWLKELQLVQQSEGQKAFENNGERIIAIYKNSASLNEWTKTPVTTPKILFNILWSNVQVLGPSLYARLPKVVVERRFKDYDPIGRMACMIAERATQFQLSIQQDRVNYAIRSAVQDRLLPGRGNVWLRYEAGFKNATDELGEGFEQEEVLAPNTEKVLVDPLFWLDYFEAPSRNPYEVRWKARRVYMTREELKKRFGDDIGSQVAMYDSRDWKPIDTKNMAPNFLQQAEVFEIYDYKDKQIIWISPGYKKGALDVKPDYLKLIDFYCCPVPLMATKTSESSYPTPDYIIYEGLATELEHITERIGSMIDCIRLVGVTASENNALLKNVTRLADGETYPVKNWTSWAEKGGFKGAIDWLPFDQCVAAIPVLVQQQQNLLQQIFEITGIPDIVRGSTDPNETLGAQQQKGRWTVVKIADKQDDVQRFCREIVSRIAEIIFQPGLFSDETIALMCGLNQMNPIDQMNFWPALGILRSDEMRTFRVDIETDSTIAMDEAQEKQSRMEFINTITQIVGQIQQVTTFAPELLNPMIESALFAARAFRSGRPLEGAWENALKQIEDNQKAAKENPPPPPPDYTAQQLQLEGQRIQIEGMKAQTEQQYKIGSLQLENQKMMADYQIDSQDLGIKAQQVYSKQQIEQMDADIKKFKENFLTYIELEKLDLEKKKTVWVQTEKLIDDARLEKDNMLEAAKILNEAHAIRQESETKAKESSGGSKGSNLTLNINGKDVSMDKPKRNRKRFKMARIGTELVGESEDIPDEVIDG